MTTEAKKQQSVPGNRALVIRADAGSRMGAGHVMRTLALAQALQDQGGQVVFSTSCAGAPLGRRLEEEGFRVEPMCGTRGSGEDAGHAVRLAQEVGADWIVADGYEFGCEFQRRVREAGIRLLSVDDYGSLECFGAEIVLNQNPSAREALYSSRAAHCRLLLGTRYALLRRDFRRLQGWQREIAPAARRLLVTLGGADHDNVTALVLSELKRLERDDLEVTVVVGGENRNQELLGQMAEQGGGRIELVRDVQDMAGYMTRADVAISAGGGTCWEMAFLGLPNLILVLADNQADSAAELDRLGVSVNLGRPSADTGAALRDSLTARLCSAERRAAMSSRGKKLVDGNGVERVLEAMARYTV